MRHNELDRVIYEEAREQYRNRYSRAVDRAGTDTLERPVYT